jgi:hypothetical protein
MALYKANNGKVGDVDEVVTEPDNRLHLVVKQGGLSGLGDRRVA